MDIFGIGPLEFLLILIIMLIILGPNDMVKAGRTIGTFLRKLILSDEWRIVQQAGKEFKNLPERLVREAGIEDIKKDLPTLDEIKKDLPDLNEITAQSGLPELEKDLQRDFSKTIEAAKQAVPTDGTGLPPAPTVQTAPTAQPAVSPSVPAAPARSYEAFMQKPAPGTTPQPAVKPSVPAVEFNDDDEDEPDVSPWVNSPTIPTPADPLSAGKKDASSSTDSTSNPTQS